MSQFVHRPGVMVAGRYLLHEPLGEGGMGVVYMASDQTLGRVVAVKLLLPEFSAEAESQARFVREAKVAATLRHPNAVQIYDFGTDAGRLFLVMEMLHGCTVRDFLDSRQRFDVHDTVRIAYQVADVLSVAHEVPLVHRDLKPENIFIQDGEAGNERISVLDFGMAFIAEDAADDTGRLTAEGLSGGTPAYMSPEQVAAKDVGPLADVYSLGCVMFEMLTGEPPFDGEMMKILSKQLYQKPRAVTALRADVPPALDELVRRMLKKPQHERPSAEQVRKRLANMKPELLGGAERSRDVSFAPGATSARPASESAAPVEIETEATEPVVGQITLAVVGPLDTELALGLAANGIETLALDPNTPAHAVFAPGAKPTAVASLVAIGLPVISDAAPANIGRIAALLRSGVAEVVGVPTQVDEVARKVRRAVRKSRNPS